MVYGQVSSNLLALSSFLILRLINTVPRIKRKGIAELLGLGLTMIPSFAFLFLLMHANKFILEWQHGLDAVGIYSICFNLGLVLSVVVNGIGTAWYPFFMGYIGKENHAAILFGKIFTYYIVGIRFLTLYFLSLPSLLY